MGYFMIRVARNALTIVMFYGRQATGLSVQTPKMNFCFFVALLDFAKELLEIYLRNVKIIFTNEQGALKNGR